MSATAQTVNAPYRMPLITMISSRDSSINKDALLKNCVAEKDPETGEYWVWKRYGLTEYSEQSGLGQGVYNWQGNLYAIFGGVLYKNGVMLGNVDTTNGQYRFQIVMGFGWLMLGNGTKTYYTNGTTLTELLIDVDFPQSLVKGFAYLDGTIYVMSRDGRIWGSRTQDDPTQWDPLNFLRARVEPDQAVVLAKQQSYVVALKEWTSEVFYDAGNASGSPLAPVQGAKSPFGCASADSLQSIDDILLWITNNRAASPRAAMMVDLRAQVISTPAIDRLLAGADFTNVFSWSFKQGGHRFYGVTFKNSNLTLVYDLDQSLWYVWTDTNDNYWPIVSETFLGNDTHIVQHETNGKLYTVHSDSDVPTDDGEVVSVEIRTINATFGVDRRKTLNIMRFNGDQVPGSILEVRVSDDDYQTWSQWRQVDLSRKRPILTKCGTFYRRAWHLRHRRPTSFRIKTVDLQMDMGSL